MSLSLNRSLEDQEAAIDGRAEQQKNPLGLPWDSGEVEHHATGFQVEIVDADGETVGWIECWQGDESRAQHLLTAANNYPPLLAERDALVKAATAMVEAHNNWLWGTDEAERVDEAADHLRALLAPERQVADE